MDWTSQDVLFALRSYRREPTLVLTVMLTIGLGVGLNAAAFTLFNAYVLRPAPVRDPGSLQEVVWNSKGRLARRFSWDQYRELGALPVVAEALGYRAISTRFDRRRVAGQFVTGNYFSMLGVGPALGRVLQADDGASPGSAPVAVLNHRFWVSSFASDSSVVGQLLRIRGVNLTIIGVAPKDFDGLEPSPPDFWAPITMATVVENQPDLFAATEAELAAAVVRFRPGVSPPQGGRELEQWLRQATAHRPEADRATGVRLESRATPNPFSPGTILALMPILMAFVLVLLAACANVASMMVARGVARQREIGIRLAIGAGRRRLIQQLLTESLVLAAPAAVAGLLISRLIVSGSLAALFATIPEMFVGELRVTSLEADARVHLFMVAASAGAAVIFGLIPAFQATRPVAREPRGSSRLRGFLVVGQIAVAALLLITTGVLLRGSKRAERVNLGFKTDGVLALDLNPTIRDRVTERLRQLPEVRIIAATTTVPLVGPVRVVGIQPAPGGPVQGAVSLSVSAGFFDLLQIGLIRGRGIADDEGRAGASVAVVNEMLARQYWHGLSPIDQTFLLIEGTTPPRAVRVIGVVPDAVIGWVGERARPTVFLPTSLSAPGTTVLIRVDDDSPAAQRALEETLTLVDPASTENLFSMADVMAVSIYPYRLAFWIAASIGLVALLLTLTGVYGMMAFVVAERTREIGVRLALGSTRARVVRLILGQSGRLAAIGIGIAIPLAIGAAAAAATAIEVMDVFEPIAYFGGAAVVLAACAVGALVPSRRAARIEPLEAIRAE